MRRPSVISGSTDPAAADLAVQVQQRPAAQAGWRTIEGLADFAIVHSYLSTAANWGLSKLDALRSLFNGHAWLPPGLEPAA
jgi:transposase